MPYFEFLWTAEIIEHIGEHGVSQGEFELVVCDPESKGISRSTGLPVAWRHLPDGRYIIAVFNLIDELTVLPVSAYEVSSPK